MRDPFDSNAAKATLRDVAVQKLRSLGIALNLILEEVNESILVFDLLSESWGETPIADRPPWPNDITDDGTPFEFSVAIQPDCFELRMLTESQLGIPSPTSTWLGGLEVHRRLEERGLASFSNFGRVADIFAPLSANEARFSLWHAAVLRTGCAPLFKAYMNPQVHGPAQAADVVREALQRLGLSGAWEFLSQRVSESGRELSYFSLDLHDDEAARVKVYVASPGPARVMESLLNGAGNMSATQVAPWLRQLTGTEGPYWERPILACFSFTRSKQTTPDATLHVPIRCYATDDSQAAARITALLEPGSRAVFERVIAASSTRPLGVGRGLITYASLRPTPAGTRLTAYLAPQVYSIASPRPEIGSSAPYADSTVGFSRIHAAIDSEVTALADHPFVGCIALASDVEVLAISARLTLLCMLVSDASRTARRNLPAPFNQQLEPAQALRPQILDFQQLVESRFNSRQSALWGFDADGETARDWAYDRIREILSAKDAAECAAAVLCLTALLAFLLEQVRARLELAAAETVAAEGEESGSRSGYALIIRASDFSISAESSLGAEASVKRTSLAVSRLASELQLLTSSRTARTAKR